MVKLNIPESEFKKGSKSESFYTLKNILKKNISDVFKEGNVIRISNSKITFKIISVSFYDDMKEAIEKTGYEKFKVGNSVSEVYSYYYALGNNRKSSKWETVVLELKRV